MKVLIKNEEAQAGVGTLIIFIAMVLVAAVAAAVLLSTQGTMNAKSAQITKSSATAVGENINFVGVAGVQSSNVLNGINITIQGAPGSSVIDLSRVVLTIQGQNFNYSALWGNGTPSQPTNSFGVWPIRLALTSDVTTLGGVGSYSSVAAPGLDPGSLVRLDANVAGLSLGPSASVSLTLTPQSGAPVPFPVMLPAFSGANVSIYP